MARKKIKDRILEHYKPGIRYYDLMLKVFPPEDYPRAFEGAPKGGPPGCAMAFGRALRELRMVRGSEDRIFREKP